MSHDHKVRIHIDQVQYESPNPTTGAALYLLGNVKHGRLLYREVRGDREDPPIENGPETIHLREDEHFHTGDPRAITLIVEGTPHEWFKASITYAELVTLFDPNYPQHPETTYSVTYDHGPAHNPEGILSPGASVEVKDRMVFHVSRTGQS
jgi:hypothetical protein